jgi:hypothetical protein
VKQNYFVYNGNRYYSGDKLVFRRFSKVSRCLCDVNVVFLYYDTDDCKYYIETYGESHGYTSEDFYKNIKSVYTDRVEVVETQNKSTDHTFLNELNIDSLFIAWAWYIFIMVVGTIFYDRIGIWVFASVLFFNYRNKKLKEEGYK